MAFVYCSATPAPTSPSASSATAESRTWKQCNTFVINKFKSIASMPIVFSRLIKLVAAVLATILLVVWNYKTPIISGTISPDSVSNSIPDRSTASWTSPLVELPDQNDRESRAFLRHLLKTGSLLELANTVKPRNREQDNSSANLLSVYYPDGLNLKGHRFWTIDGRELSAYRIITAIWDSSSKLLPIPNVVHFYMFYPNQHGVQLQFHNFLAILSAVWLSGADKVIIWCSAKPDGRYWRQLKQNLTTHGKQNRLVLATRPLPHRVFNHAVNIIEHRVDVMKLETGILLGGIILDTDALTLRSLQPLRSHDCVIGRESSIGLTIGAFMSKPRAVFLLLWYMLYQTFDDTQWNQHSVLLPNNIWRKFPNLCRVENQSIARPGWSESELKILYGDQTNDTKTSRWNWHNNYMLHLWKLNRPEVNETSVRTLNSMFGQVVRFILYGTELLWI